MPLTEQQKDILEATGKAILVLAGPGTGKTEVLAHRILFLLKSDLATREELVGITFTRKAADKMSERLSELGLDDSDHPLICTLHSLARRILRGNEEAAGIPNEFSVADQYEQLLVLEDAIEDVQPRLLKKPTDVLHEVLLLKSKRQRPEDLPSHHWLSRIYRRYQELLRFHQALDFEDLVVEACSLLEREAPICSAYQRQCTNILVDEFQDMNRVEYALVNLLAGEGHGLFVLADDDQTIYAFRGSDPAILKGFTEHHKGGELKFLTTCFRCPDTIILGALGLVANNPDRIDKQLEPLQKGCKPIKALHFKSDVQEARWIARWVKERVESGECQLQNIAVLSRGGDVADKIAAELGKLSIPVTRPSPKETQHVREYVAHLRLVADRRDSLAVMVCLRSRTARGVGRKGIKNLRYYAEEENCSLWDSLIIAQKDTAFRFWHQSLSAFVSLIEELNAELSKLPLRRFLTKAARTLGYQKEPRVIDLMRRAESLPEDHTLYSFIQGLRGAGGEKAADTRLTAEAQENAVLIITMHSVKGLEKDVVFVVGMEKGTFPQTRGNLEEERRLCYVAMTRAKKELFLCCSRKREGQSAKGFNFYDPSQFLFEIPHSCKQDIYPSN